MKVEIQEECMWPLTSPTTCYSGARSIFVARDDDPTVASSSCFLSTALHSIQVSWRGNESLSSSLANNLSPRVPTLSWEPVNTNETTNHICVGHASNTQHTVLALMANMESLVEASNAVAVANLDEETVAQLRELISTSAGTTVTTAETDTASVTTALTESSAPTQYSRRNSSTDDVMSTIADIAAESSTHVAAQPPLPPLQGWLVWKDAHDMTTIRGTLEIDFRPLAMTLATAPIVHNDTTTRRPVLWMGSADSTRLMAYYWKDETSQLISLALDEEVVFDVGSPIMAIDVQEIVGDDASHSYLAVACQDGTVRCLQYEHYNVDTQTWSVKQVSQVIVDGPLVCLRFMASPETFLVGSLCGYVFLQNNDTGIPALVAAELQQGDNVEDPVLAVHGWEEDNHSWVVIGTQGGAFLLYYKDKNKDITSYVKAGGWHLPYSIHEICHYPANADTKNTRLLVTTRKSFHLFRLHPRPPANARLAKERIQRLLQRASRYYWYESPTTADEIQPKQVVTEKQEGKMK